MPSSLSELRPYKSLLLGRIREGINLDGVVDSALREIIELIHDRPGLEVKGTVAAASIGELEAGFIHYAEQRQATWTTDPAVQDVIQHLVLICRREHHIAIYASDHRFREVLRNKFQDLTATTGLGATDPISPGELNAAFVQGPTRTLWLGGTHSRTSVKADSKVLAGLDLRDALDPLGDQSYYFSAARTVVQGVKVPVGVTPRRSSIWAGISTTWKDFLETVQLLLRHLSLIIEPNHAPLPVLALSTSDTSRVQNAFDVSLQPPELLADDPTIDEETRADAERWAFRSYLKVTKTDGADFEARAFFDREPLGTLDFEIDLSLPQRVKLKVGGEPESVATADLHEQARRHCEKRTWLKIRYDSGHTISDGSVFEVRFRDMPFRNFAWADLNSYVINQEKPATLQELGKHNSLFDWVQHCWPNLNTSDSQPGGWLACDDRPMEIADFVHLQEASEPPVLTLIHVKAAKNSSPNREISVSAYEVVVGQAIKNLRRMDRTLLEKDLVEGLSNKVGQLVWHNRQQRNREQFLQALETVGDNYERKLVILQPHVAKHRHDLARKNGKGAELTRLKQLDTLLLAADADAHALGASLTVIGDGTPRS